MPKLTQLTVLFRAIGAQDWTAAKEAAQAIADAEDRIGHRPAATSLRGALLSNGRGINGVANPVGASASALPLMPLRTDVALPNVRLLPSSRAKLARVLLEWRNRHRLERHGVSARHSLLFVGPPGCGKTMTARAMASELGLPAFVVRFDRLIGSYLGQTASRLAELFTFSATTPCVLVLDEVDALGGKRGRGRDVGELDRVVIALMQHLEHIKPQGLIIATSNIPEQLDSALLRRFGDVITFARPSRAALRSYLSDECKRRGVDNTRRVIAEAQRANSYAAAFAAVEDALRNQLLHRLEDGSESK